MDFKKLWYSFQAYSAWRTLGISVPSMSNAKFDSTQVGDPSKTKYFVTNKSYVNPYTFVELVYASGNAPTVGVLRTAEGIISIINTSEDGKYKLFIRLGNKYEVFFEGDGLSTDEILDRIPGLEGIIVCKGVVDFPKSIAAFSKNSTDCLPLILK